MIKYLIVGTGRCGTGYVSQVFNQVGVKCGHEVFFTWDGWNPALLRLQDEQLSAYRAESSWLAVPSLNEMKKLNKDLIVIHLIRDPVKTIESLMKLRTLEERHYGDFILEQSKVTNDHKNLLNKTVGFYLDWNDKIERCADVVHKVEDNYQNLFKCLGVEVLNSVSVDVNYNTRPGNYTLNFRDIEVSLRHKLTQFMDANGYYSTG